MEEVDSRGWMREGKHVEHELQVLQYRERRSIKEVRTVLAATNSAATWIRCVLHKPFSRVYLSTWCVGEGGGSGGDCSVIIPTNSSSRNAAGIEKK